MSSSESVPDRPVPLLDVEMADEVFGFVENDRDRQALVAMLDRLRAELPGELDVLDAAWAAGDGRAGRRQCHRLRGILANYGLAGAADLLAEGEMLSPGAVMSVESRREVRTRVAAGLALLLTRFPFLQAATITPPSQPDAG